MPRTTPHPLASQPSRLPAQSPIENRPPSLRASTPAVPSHLPEIGAKPTASNRIAATCTRCRWKPHQTLLLPARATRRSTCPCLGLVSADRGMYRRHAPPGPLRRNHFARNHSAPTSLASLALRSSLARPRTKKSRPYGLRRRSTPEVVTPEHPDHREPTKQGDTK